MDPGNFIPIALASYSGAAKAWTVFRAVARFSDDADDLVLRLGLERFRFEAWGRSAGLEQDTFHDGLFPVLELVTQVLDRIKALFGDADALRNRYGLLDAVKVDVNPGTAEKLIARMQQSVRSSVLRPEMSSRIEFDVVREIRQAPALQKVYWGLRDKEKFQRLVERVEFYIEKLNQLLTESQRRSYAEDQARANIAIVGNVIDQESLEVIRKAIEIGMQNHSISTLVERKALSAPPWLSNEDSGTSQEVRLKKLTSLQLKDFGLMEDSELPKRFLAKHAGRLEELFLFEKKDHPREFSSSREAIVTKRVERLVLLLNRPREDMRTLKACGFIMDRPRCCWWLVFYFPCVHEINNLTTLLQPVSLSTLLDPNISKARPALEKRLVLAYQLANTVSALYSSSWMHKSLRSDNLLFQRLYDPARGTSLEGVENLGWPLLAGFEFSRQHIDNSSLDGWRRADNWASMYRHPNYQGEAAAGYVIEYDMYSLGLILVEIALWQPLTAYLDDRFTKSTSDSGIPASDTEKFSSQDAKALQKKVMDRVDTELAFRVGTVYRDVVRWCLTAADPCVRQKGFEASRRGENEDWHPALQFYNHVVVPLSRAIKGGIA